MAEADAITIPSPSVFLRDSPPPATQPSASRDRNTSSKSKDASATAPGAAKHARKQSGSAGAKKASSRKGSAAVAVGEGGVAKPKQSKSRNGCVTCKAKRLKCGEEKPGCAQCLRRNVECGGYKKDFKWRPFNEETNIKINSNPAPKQKRASPPHQQSNGTSKTTSPVVENASRPGPSSAGLPPTQVARPARQIESRSRPQTPDEPQGDTMLSVRTRPAPPSRRRTDERNPRSRAISPLRHQAEPAPPPSVPDGDQRAPSLSQMDEMPPFDITLPGQYPPTVASRPGLSPTLTEMLMPFVNTPQAGADTDFDDLFPLPPTNDPAINPFLLGQQTPQNGNHVATPPVRSPQNAHTLWQARYNPMPTSSNSSASPEARMGLWQHPVNFMTSQPFFSEDSEEALTFRFDQFTCGILSIFDASQNPWRNLVWPLAHRSPALRHAISAMTAFHASYDVPALRIRGHEHKQASIRYIQEGIRDNSMTDHTAIATALALGKAESWDTHTASGNSHIKGAQALVKRAIAQHQRQNLVGLPLARLKFLVNAWVYMDVIARLTSVDSDDSEDFDNTFLFAPNPPNVIMGNSPNSTDQPIGFGIDFGIGIDARLDPLMGCANTLFPLVGRVANLVRRVCRSKYNTPAIITAANDLKLALDTWEPPARMEPPEDATCEVQHAVQTAEAYRWATLLHLHQAVPELPFLTSEELSQKVLIYLATVPLSSRTVIVQIYPLMVAGCEALDEGYRTWVRERWAAMSERMRVGLLEKCMTVTEEVWRRRDAYEAQPSSRRKLVATSDVQPTRQRGVPLMRSRSDFEEAGPGRAGVVFSWDEGEGIDFLHGGGGDGEGRRGGRGGGGGGGGDGYGNGPWPWWPRRNRPNTNNMIGCMDAAYTVRGHLHWVGVMWDWGWEILLG